MRARVWLFENRICHAPTVVARLDRAIQYSRGVEIKIEKPRRTGYPAFAGYDDV
jgi:hypothetical protein